jgi:hypothetical protein
MKGCARGPRQGDARCDKLLEASATVTGSGLTIRGRDGIAARRSPAKEMLPPLARSTTPRNWAMRFTAFPPVAS